MLTPSSSHHHINVKYGILSDRLQVQLFDLDSQQLVQSNEHALTVIRVGENEEDVTNEACAFGISPTFSENLPSDIH